jgi:hypothetical protein
MLELVIASCGPLAKCVQLRNGTFRRLPGRLSSRVHVRNATEINYLEKSGRGSRGGCERAPRSVAHRIVMQVGKSRVDEFICHIINKFLKYKISKLTNTLVELGITYFQVSELLTDAESLARGARLRAPVKTRFSCPAGRSRADKPFLNHGGDESAVMRKEEPAC